MKIAVFRALQLGDILCSIPAIRVAKKNFPHAQIYVLGLKHMKSLVLRYPFVDAFVHFPGYPGLPEQVVTVDEVELFVQHMCEMQFDLLIQMHGNGTVVNDLLYRCEASRLVGYCPDQLGSNADWMVYPDGIHEVARHLALTKYLGLSVSPEDYEMDFPLYAEDRENFRALKESYGLHRYAVVHVGSRSALRQWPLSHFLVLAEHLMQQGLQLVLTGTEEERSRVNEMQRMIGRKVISLVSKTGLGELGCLLQEAEILVCNCTGISHMAAALKTKSIVISLDGEPERWGPMNHNLHYTYNGTQELNLSQIRQDMDRLLRI